jgi:Tfp pilus assembly protein PilZ
VQSLVVEYEAHLHFATRVVEISPVVAVVGQGRGIAVQFSLEEPHDLFDERIIVAVVNSADRCTHA